MKKNQKMVAGFLAAMCVVGSSAALATDANTAPAADAAAQLANPMREVTLEELTAETGYVFTLPEGALEAVYAIIDGAEGAEKTAQAQFKLGEDVYTCRMQPGEAEADITGMFFEWTETKEVTFAEVEKAILNLMNADQGALTWYDAEAKINYSVTLDAAASEEKLVAAATALVTPVEEEAANG